MVNLSSFIRYHAARTPEKTALVYAGQAISYAELEARVLAVAAALASRGAGPGDIVAMMMKNSAAFIEIAFAASYLGAIFLPVNYRLAADEVGFITDNAEARLILADEEFSDRLPPGLDTVLLDGALQADAAAWRRLMRASRRRGCGPLKTCSAWSTRRAQRTGPRG